MTLIADTSPLPSDVAIDGGENPVRICFFFNAQRHQLLHGISTAVELARVGGFDVHVASPSADHIAYARELTGLLGGAPITFTVASPAILEAWRRRSGKSVPPKLLTLAVLARYLNGFDAIAIPERTTILLKRFGARSPLYVHLDHGAGDRAVGFDPRIRFFDLVLMAGRKHRERMKREGLIREGAYAVVGYPKFDAADVIRDPGFAPFADDRPVVLYNPHFSDLGSWERFGLPLLRAFVDQDRYNLIIAPHVRMFDGAEGRLRWAMTVAEFAGEDHILLDPGSDRAIDMSYTMLADVYVGDVSSQIYEFLRTPKPCLFLDAHGIDWQHDENYTHWRYGPVVTTTDDLLGAVDTACATHAAFRQVQIDGFQETFSTNAVRPSVRAAAAIADYLRMRVRRGSSAPWWRAIGRFFRSRHTIS